MAIIISEKVETKLRDKHGVTPPEVDQCFENLTGKLLKDTREGHRTDPPTLWFIAPTNRTRLLKICLIQRGDELHIRTAYPPNDVELRIYKSLANPTDF